MKVKSHRLHVGRKMKENNGKLKKIETSLIKRFLRISWYILSIQFWSTLSLFSLSHSCTPREFLEHSNIRSRKEKEGKRRQREEKIK